MYPNETTAPPTSADKSNKAQIIPAFLLCLVWLISDINDVVSDPARHYLWVRILPPLLFNILLLALMLGTKTVLGKILYLQIHSPQTVERIRTRYRDEADQFAALGFTQVFCFGEGFSVLRLFLIFPALIVISLLRKGEIVLMQDGNIVESYAVFAARDNSAFVHAFGLGVKFYTSFQDGTLLISKNFVNNMGNRPGIVEFARKASIREVYAEHQRQIQMLEAQGKRINRQSSFEFYSELSRKDS